MLRRAAHDKRVPGREVFRAMKVLEEADLACEEWPSLLADGRGWYLVFSSIPKDVEKDRAGKVGSGFNFPLAAAQCWRLSEGSIRNGVYLPHVAALQLLGTMVISENKRVVFDFDRMRVKLGPFAKTFKLKDPPTLQQLERDTQAPFLHLAYVDDNICVARRRDGGIAYWERTTPAWEIENGLV